MQSSFSGLYWGLAFSIILIYLLVVVNFQSWTEPFIVITALPCALTGIVWMLFITGTTLSVPALMGTIMCMGVATSNSVLIDTPQVDQHLNEARAQLDVAQAALDLSGVTYKRDADLYRQNVIAAQDVDTAADNYHGNQSTVISDEANVKRLAALEDFKIVKAPFEGIVTVRNTDIGWMVNAGSGNPFSLSPG